MTTRRKFSVDTASLATSKPTIPAGVYAAQIVNAGIKIQNDWTINFRKDYEWVNNKPVDLENGNYIIEGMLNYGVLLLSKKAIKTLQIDEPRLFGGRINLRYDKKTFILEDNHIFGRLLEVLGIKDIDFDSELDWEWDDNIEIPEELSGFANAVDLLNGLAYTRAFFTKVAEYMNGVKCKAVVGTRAKPKDPESKENFLDCGKGANASCGVISYSEGCEEDLEEKE